MSEQVMSTHDDDIMIVNGRQLILSHLEENATNVGEKNDIDLS